MISQAILGGAALLALGACATSFSRTPPAAGMGTYPAATASAPQSQWYGAQPGDPYAGTAYAQGAAPSYPATPAYTAAPDAAGPVPSAPFPAAPATPAPAAASGIEGLEERKPDLCGAEKHRGAVGQPGSAIPSLGVEKTYRVVEYRGIEPQDYDPNRIVFRLDAAGNITNVDCG